MGTEGFSEAVDVGKIPAPVQHKLATPIFMQILVHLVEYGYVDGNPMFIWVRLPDQGVRIYQKDECGVWKDITKPLDPFIVSDEERHV